MYQDFYLVLWDHPFDQTLRFVDFGLALERVQRCQEPHSMNQMFRVTLASNLMKNLEIVDYVDILSCTS